jgi:hypothetical protein
MVSQQKGYRLSYYDGDMRSLRIAVSLAGVLSVGVISLDARVTRIVVEHRESPAYGGKIFGKAGQYELLSGHFTGELDPKDPHNTIINDILLAVRNARGMVEYTGTFAIAKPLDMSKASSVLMYSVPNRGNGAPAADADGHISVVSGWQGDLAPRPNAQTIVVPIARNADGSPITGPMTAVFIDSPAGAHTLALRAPRARSVISCRCRSIRRRPR